VSSTPETKKLTYVPNFARPVLGTCDQKTFLNNEMPSKPPVRKELVPSLCKDGTKYHRKIKSANSFSDRPVGSGTVLPMTKTLQK